MFVFEANRNKSASIFKLWTLQKQPPEVFYRKWCS